MFQAITTQYFGPTNTKHSRIRAKCAAGSVVVEWDDSLSPDNNHQHAADVLRAKLIEEARARAVKQLKAADKPIPTKISAGGWEKQLAGGCMANGHRVFVFVD